jgi:hypothetical protein
VGSKTLLEWLGYFSHYNSLIFLVGFEVLSL